MSYIMAGLASYLGQNKTELRSSVAKAYALAARPVRASAGQVVSRTSLRYYRPWARRVLRPEAARPDKVTLHRPYGRADYWFEYLLHRPPEWPCS